jgi:hypothetical protein
MTIYPYLPSNRRDHEGKWLPGPVQGRGGMTDTPQVLLAHHLKTLKLPTFHSP